MAENSVTVSLSKLQAGVLTSVLAAGAIALITNLISLNRGMIELETWKTALDAQDSVIKNTLPRSEWNLEKQYMGAELEQLRQRLILLENKDRR